jgi:hypothetical protein
MGTLLRYPYEVRSEDFDDIQDVKAPRICSIYRVGKRRQPQENEHRPLWLHSTASRNSAQGNLVHHRTGRGLADRETRSASRALTKRETRPMGSSSGFVPDPRGINELGFNRGRGRGR